MVVVVTTRVIRHGKLQLNCHQQTNDQLFTGRMLFLSPTNSVKALKETVAGSSTTLLTANLLLVLVSVFSCFSGYLEFTLSQVP